MSRKYKFKKRVKTTMWEDKEIEIDLPLFCKYHSDISIFYKMLDEHLNLTTIIESYDCITDYGRHQNLSYEITFEKPHEFDYSYDFYTEKTSSKEEFMNVLATIMETLEEIK